MVDEEIEITEDSRRELPDGTVEVRGHWVARARGGKAYRRAHRRRRRR
jgi:hypothetical protein